VLSAPRGCVIEFSARCMKQGHRRVDVTQTALHHWFHLAARERTRMHQRRIHNSD